MTGYRLKPSSDMKPAFNPLAANFSSPGSPIRSYVIASTPRSGSTLLAQTLFETGLAGAPHEYLNRIFIKEWYEKWGDIGIPDYLQRLTELNTSPNGVFALKTHYHQLEAAVLKQGLELADLLPDLTYIRIDRGDRIRQAISFWRAYQTNNWAVGTSGSRVANYDLAGICARLRELVEDELGWDNYFRERNIVPLRIYYEELENNFQPTIRNVLRHLDLEESIAELPEQPLAKQRDETTEEWYARFVRDIEPKGLMALVNKLQSGLARRFS